MRRSLGISLALALVLCLPTARLGFILDDYKLLAHAEGLLSSSRPLDYFTFARDPAVLREDLRTGPYPWWTLPELRIAFYRPLSSALVKLDAFLFGRVAWAWHLHSIAWFLGLLVALAALYRRALGEAAGGLALILFALDDVHWVPVGWLANRNSLVSALPVILGLVAYLRFREEGWAPGRWLAAVGLAGGLAGGEAGLSVAGYFVAYELTSSDPLRTRLGAIAPVVAVALTWAGLYRGFGYGAWGSSIYVDPGLEPVQFLKVAPQRLLVELGALTLKASSDLWIVVPPLRSVLIVLGAIGAAVAALALRSLWSSFEDRERRALKWMILGALFALVPGLATFPTDRLLLAASIGTLGAFAVLLRTAWKREGRGARAVVVWLGLATILLPPTGWFLGPWGFEKWARGSEASILEGDPTRFDRPVVLLDCVDYGAALYGAAWLHFAGRATPHGWWPIAVDPHAHRLRRVGERALELESVGGRMVDTSFEQLARSEQHPILTGETAELDGLKVTVIATDRGRPTALRLDFERALTEYRLLTWAPGKLAAIAPPEDDAVIELPAQPSPMEFHF